MSGIARLYDNLSRFTYYLQVVRHLRRPELLSMHKVIRDPGARSENSETPGESDQLDELAFRVADLPDNPHVLDIGCGFGTTLFRWFSKKSGNYQGFTISPFQLKISRKIARRRNCQDRCEFFLRSFEDKITDHFDAIVSIESLIHASDLQAVLKNLVHALKEDGRLIIVEDLACRFIDSGNRAGQILRNTWFLDNIWSLEDYETILDTLDAELIEKINLTPFIEQISIDKIRSRLKGLSVLKKILMLPAFRLFINTHLGGYALQQLYREGKVGYQLLVFRKRK